MDREVAPQEAQDNGVLQCDHHQEGDLFLMGHADVQEEGLCAKGDGASPDGLSIDCEGLQGVLQGLSWDVQVVHGFLVDKTQSQSMQPIQRPHLRVVS